VVPTHTSKYALPDKRSNHGAGSHRHP
jgi:hypothetical protein